MAITRERIATYVFLLGLAIGLVHYGAISFYLYWEIPFLDLVMHFFGGVWVGLLTLWVLWALYGDLKRSRVYLGTFLFITVIGVFWEVFEYYTGLSFVAGDFWIDTITDLCMDVLGAFLVVWGVVRSIDK